MTKFGNRRTDYNGRVYASKLEADKAELLDILMYAEDEAHRVAEWTSDKERCRMRFGLADKWHVYTFDFRVRWAKATAHHDEEEYWETKGVWAPQDRWRLDACRDWLARNGTPITVRVVYKDGREEVLR